MMGAAAAAAMVSKVASGASPAAAAAPAAAPGAAATTARKLGSASKTLYWIAAATPCDKNLKFDPGAFKDMLVYFKHNGADGIVVAAGADAVSITELQKAGAKRMSAATFLGGSALDAGARLGT